MIHRANGTQYLGYRKWDSLKNAPYDYAQDGLLQHLISHRIYQSQNPVLRYVLSYYEKSIVFLLKYIDILKNFKNIHWLNR